MKKKFSMTILCLVAMFTSANAQEILPLENAIALALKNNFSIQLAQKDTMIANNSNTLGNAGFAPSVELIGGYDLNSTNAKQEFISGEVREIDAAKTEGLTGRVQLNWTLFDGFYMFAEKDKLEAFESQSRLQLKADIEENIAQVQIAYFKVVQQARLIESIKSAIDISYKRAEVIEKRRKIGSSSQTELLQAQVDLNKDSSLYYNQVVAIEISKAELNYLLGRDAATTFTTDTFITSVSDLNYNQLNQQLVQQNYSILAAKKQSEISMLMVKQERSKLYPQLDFIANYSGANINSGSGFMSLNQNYGPAIGLVLRMNIFDGNKNRINVKNAQVESEIALLQETELRASVNTQLYSAYQNYISAKKLVTFERKSLQLAQANLDLAIEKYRIGSINQLEFREAQRAQLEADGRYLTAEYQAKANEILMKKLVGRVMQ